MLEPVSVALQFGFLAVLYLFLLWVARSALKDLRRSAEAGVDPHASRAPIAPEGGTTSRLPSAMTTARRRATPAPEPTSWSADWWRSLEE